MSTKKLPAFQFYPSDWKSDIKVQSLEFHDRGIWFEMLCLMHESEQRGKLVMNGKSMERKMIARLIGTDLRTLNKSLDILISAGVAYVDEAGVIFNRRMVNDEKLRLVRMEAGSQGGNPALLNQKDNQKDNQTVKQNPTPSSSSSISLTNNSVGVVEGAKIFDLFRKQYPGTKRSLETEFSNFQMKHKNWKEILPLLATSLKNQIESRAQKEQQGEWVPPWKHLRTWINNRGWEEEQSDPKVKNISRNADEHYKDAHEMIHGSPDAPIEDIKSQ